MSPALEAETSPSTGAPRIRIVGIGGAGGNILDGLDKSRMDAVEFVGVNTDAQALEKCSMATKLLIGAKQTRGLGTGGEVEIARAALEEDRDRLAALVEGVDLLILLAGMGGGTGSAVATALAELAAGRDCLVLAFVTMPFNFEGQGRRRIAEGCLGELRRQVHGIIPLPNDVLLQECEETASAVEAFSLANDWIELGLASICSMLLRPGLVNQDFGSLRAIFRDFGGKALFGIGAASGESRVEGALQQLFLCPLLHLGDRPGAFEKILVNIIGGPDLGLGMVNTILSKIREHYELGEDLILGAMIDEAMEDKIELCMLAKAELEGGRERISQAGDPERTRSRDPVGQPFGLETEISEDDRPPQPVHSSKLRSKKRGAQPENQDEFEFIDLDAQRGYFNRSEKNLYRGEDLDVPTYLRRGIKIRLRA